MKNSIVAVVGLSVFAGLFLAARTAALSLPVPEWVMAGERPPTTDMSEEHREKYINSTFSAWDGTNLKLVRDVKSDMRNPESFEHVSTSYKDTGGDTLFVTMKYRCKNATGNIITRTISADVFIKTND